MCGRRTNPRGASNRDTENFCSWKILEQPLYAAKDGNRHFGDVVILYCAGRLVFGDETAAFRERIKNILLGTQQIVVNLAGIEHGEIKLVGPNQRVADLLQRTKTKHCLQIVRNWRRGG